MSVPETTLAFRTLPIRIVQLSEVPWFALPDVCDALGWRSEVLEKHVRDAMPEIAWKTCMELEDPEIPGSPEEVVILSPVGVWYLTHLAEPGRGQALASWAKREAARLCPMPAPGDPSVFLTLLGGTELPPYPMKYSGRKSEWTDLANSNEYLEAKYGLKTRGAE